jgi:transcriptional regulator with XRE-family HTH domain
MLTMAKKRIPLSEQIRRAIRSSGMTRYRICKEIGLTQPSMTRFMADVASLSLDTIDKIAELLDLNIVAGKPRHKNR